ncbi:MAG: hypothetical protein COY39_05735 [Alphaproteobacteria bacterium CG_4_10_14_0_8_um_filter_37_21]|nr:MAG: hypothetical protein COY39_05735 [Alphaproteobacteria bacterium CG_4_10_14_0_8_um_filter_37_21]
MTISLFSTINRYFAKRFLFWFMTISIAILFIVGLFEFIELLRRSMGRPYIGSRSLLEITLLKLPFYFQMFYPFIIMVASQVTLWRFNQSQEIIAVRSLGFSVWQILSSLILSVLALSILNLAVFNPISAMTQNRADVLYTSLFKKNGNSQFSINESGLWLREKTQNKASVINIETYNLAKNIFLNVNIFETTATGALEQRYMATKATLNDGFWLLEDVKSWNINYGEKDLSTLHVKTDLSIKKILESNAKPETISFWSLSSFITGLKKSGLSDLRYNLHWHVQLAKIGQALALILLAAVFCLHPTRYKKASTLIFLGLISGFVIHFLTDVVHALSLGEKIPIILGAWSPVLITFLLSTGLLTHTEQAH